MVRLIARQGPGTDSPWRADPRLLVIPNQKVGDTLVVFQSTHGVVCARSRLHLTNFGKAWAGQHLRPLYCSRISAMASFGIPRTRENSITKTSTHIRPVLVRAYFAAKCSLLIRICHNVILSISPLSVRAGAKEGFCLTDKDVSKPSLDF